MMRRSLIFNEPLPPEWHPALWGIAAVAAVVVLGCTLALLLGRIA